MVVNHKAAEAAVRDLLVALGEDPDREGLRGTPDRVARAFAELLAGREADLSKILQVDFGSNGYDEMVALRGVGFWSLCEHHLLPFYGTAAVVYIPGEAKRVVGLSKLARLVDTYARRLQIQERMTGEIADALRENLSPRGWGVLVRAKHLCMCARGVQKDGAEMVTSVVGGLIKEDTRSRDEFLRLAGL